jgi:hypothetical protein
VWQDSNGNQLHTGSAITVHEYETSDYQDYLLSMPGLKKSYHNSEQQFSLYIRPRNWTPTVYTVSQTTPEMTYLDNIYFRVIREIDGRVVVPYGTGSNETRVSYKSGEYYFKFDCSMLEPDYLYSFSVYAVRRTDEKAVS